LEAATKAESYKSAVCSEYPTYIIMSIIITIIIIIIIIITIIVITIIVINIITIITIIITITLSLSSSPDGTLETAAPIRKDPTVKAAIVSEDMVGRSYEQLLFLVNRHIDIADLIQLTPITLREEQVKR